MIRAFFRWNKAVCEKIESVLPYRKAAIWQVYLDTMKQYINRSHGAVVVDAGGGEKCPFAQFRDPSAHIRIIAVDVLAEALAKNADVDETIVVDIEKELPFADETVDVITSHMVLEHLKNVDVFFTNSRRVLKTGGHFIHIVPSKYAPFTIINQLLPKKFAASVLHFFYPEISGSGFPAYYNRCSYSEMAELLERQGFEIDELECIYYQSWYYGFFVPFFLTSVAYEWVIWKLGAKKLCAYLLIVARKKP